MKFLGRIDLLLVALVVCLGVIGIAEYGSAQQNRNVNGFANSAVGKTYQLAADDANTGQEIQSQTIQIKINRVAEGSYAQIIGDVTITPPLGCKDLASINDVGEGYVALTWQCGNFLRYQKLTDLRFVKYPNFSYTILAEGVATP